MSNKEWDRRFMEMALLVSTWSKDTTKVGAVIVGPKREVLSVGYNGFPRGVNDEIPERYERPLKYLWTVDAERNAISNAARIGTPLTGGTMYVNGDHGFPCTVCASLIVQCGIIRLVGLEPDFSLPRYAEEYKQTMQMFQEAGVAFKTGKKL